MNCTACGIEYDKETIYCHACGCNLINTNTAYTTCRTCNTSYPIGTNFCTKDGSRLQPMFNKAIMNFQKASLLNRFLASMLDGLIMILLSTPCIIIYFKTEYDNWSGYGFSVLMFLFLIIPLTYFLIKDGLGKGQSWGKKALDIVVIDLDDNTPCDKGKSFVRNLLSGIISIVPFVGWLVDPIIVLARKDGKTIGDMAANTQVLDKINVKKQ